MELLLETNYQEFFTRAGIALAIFVFFLILRTILTNVIFKVVIYLSRNTRLDIDEQFLKYFLKPVKAFIVAVGLYISLNYFFTNPVYEAVLDKLMRSFLIFFVMWGLFNLADHCSGIFKNISEKYEFENDKIVLPFISKVIRFIIVALAFTIIIQEWGYNIQGFIAGLGLGGLAFALAAQDTIANVFGGLVLVTERPFKMGDWIETPSVEGTVEEFSFRSTRVRTFAQALVTIPNSTLAKQPITNWSKMGRRRIMFNLGVMYSTPPEKIEKVVQRIKELLYNHPDIDQQTIFVNFDKFNNSSLDIFLYFFTKTTVWGEFLEVKQKMNLEIMKILQEEKVSVAFPSTSVYFENALPENTDNTMSEDSKNGYIKKEN